MHPVRFSANPLWQSTIVGTFSWINNWYWIVIQRVRSISVLSTCVTLWHNSQNIIRFFTIRSSFKCLNLETKLFQWDEKNPLWNLSNILPATCRQRPQYCTFKSEHFLISSQLTKWNIPRDSKRKPIFLQSFSA